MSSRLFLVGSSQAGSTTTTAIRVGIGVGLGRVRRLAGVVAVGDDADVSAVVAVLAADATALGRFRRGDDAVGVQVDSRLGRCGGIFIFDDLVVAIVIDPVAVEVLEREGRVDVYGRSLLDLGGRDRRDKGRGRHHAAERQGEKHCPASCQPGGTQSFEHQVQRLFFAPD